MSTQSSEQTGTPPTREEAEFAAQHSAEVKAGQRFEFGKNWAAFLEVLDEARIRSATDSLVSLLGWPDLRGKTFLDIGSGSGLSSLVAHRLGATVTSFDFDSYSVACTRELRRRYGGDGAAWEVGQGSAIDPAYMGTLGLYDLVYSWGVLHHTGRMWEGLALAADHVAPGGRLFVAIYNDQGAWSGRWKKIKKFYCSGPFGRAIVSGAFIPYWVLRSFVADIVWGRNPLALYREYHTGRGMSLWHDWHDWLGGYPFEVAQPEEIFRFYRARSFALVDMKTVRGSVGCNEFVFERPLSD